MTLTLFWIFATVGFVGTILRLTDGRSTDEEHRGWLKVDPAIALRSE